MVLQVGERKKQNLHPKTTEHYQYCLGAKAMKHETLYINDLSCPRMV